MATPDTYTVEADDKYLYDWVTTGGTAVPHETPPTVKTQGTTTTNTAGTQTNNADITVDGTTGGVTIIAANANRKKAIIQNVGTANIRVGTGTLTATTGTQLVPGASAVWEAPFCPTAALKAIRETSTSSSAAGAETV